MDGGLPALGSAQHRPKSTSTTTTIAVPPWVAAPRERPRSGLPGCWDGFSVWVRDSLAD